MNTLEISLLATQSSPGSGLIQGKTESGPGGLSFKDTLAQFLLGDLSKQIKIDRRINETLPQKSELVRSPTRPKLTLIRTKDLELIKNDSRFDEKLSKVSSQSDPTQSQESEEKETINAWKKKVEELINESSLQNPLFLLDQMRTDSEVGSFFSNITDEQGIQIIQAIQEGISLESADEQGVQVIQAIRKGISLESADQSALSGELDSQTKELLSIVDELREDPESGAFWKSIDNETALSILQKLLPDDTEQILEDGKSLAQIDPQEEAGVPFQNPVEFRPSLREEFNARVGKQGEQSSQEPLPDQNATRGNVLEKSWLGVPVEADPNGATLRSIGNEAFIGKILRQEPVPGKPDSKTLVLEPVMGLKTSRMGQMAENFQQGNGSRSSGESSTSSQNSNKAFVRYLDPVRTTFFSQLIEKAHLLKGEQAQKVLTIQLKPEFLGKVHLELTSKDGSVIGRIVTENPQVKEKMDEVIPQIKNHLSELGIDLQELTVDIFAKNPDGGNGEGFSQHGFQKMNVRPLFTRAEDLGAIGEAVGPVIYHDPMIQGIDIRV